MANEKISKVFKIEERCEEGRLRIWSSACSVHYNCASVDSGQKGAEQEYLSQETSCWGTLSYQ